MRRRLDAAAAAFRLNRNKEKCLLSGFQAGYRLERKSESYINPHRLGYVLSLTQPVSLSLPLKTLLTTSVPRHETTFIFFCV